MSLEKELIKLQDMERAVVVARFFKTGEGEYGEGDKFLGITVPIVRSVARKYKYLSVNEIEKIMESPWHEVRLACVILLAEKAKEIQASPKVTFGLENKQRVRSCITQSKNLAMFYLSKTKYINNWDLVDVSSGYIIGGYLKYLSDKERIKFLSKYITSKNMWERRIAIISTLALIMNGEYKTTFYIVEKLLKDKENLIHKACGWMLREVGKRVSEKKLCEFLEKHIQKMPRTMLRYAIERLPENKRKYFLHK